LEALKLLDNGSDSKVQFKDFVEKALPLDSIPLKDALLEFPDSVACLEYILDRGYELDDCDWHYSPMPGYQDRLIIPFRHNKLLVGYTARKVVKGSPKYLSESQSGYVFNVDKQNYRSKVVFVCEGPFDALAVDGVALLTNLPNEQQTAIINSLGKTVVVVPDRDYTGMGLVKYAMDNGWLVAIPDWEDDVKDASDAFKRYGKLFTVKNLLDTATDNKVKLELMIKKYPKETKDDR
jgi:DNA primase